ncbi:MAG: helix-turn-helix domain-containing protein [Campylobacteraceae bacterium]|nr:helix-turn-helix domain-containing protein [Campylobacteraceae bacterium]
MEKKLTVIEMAELLGVSKEAIYNRIRRGSLDTVMTEGIKYVILTDEVKKSSQSRKSNNNTNDAYIQLLKDEMRELKERNKALEADKERLVLEKEKFLIKSKEEIEQVYKQKDEQLKAILTLATQGILENKLEVKKSISAQIDEFAIDVDIESENQTNKEMVESFNNWRELRDYLKQKGYSKKEKKAIKNKFSKNKKRGEN